MTQPTAEQLRLAREIVRKHYPEMTDDYSGRRVSIVLDAIQATEARMAAAVEAERARCSKLAADYAASMKPTVILGDDDSIYLTDHEQGQKDAAKRLSIMIYETAIRSVTNG
jgi:hypothetical protein